MTIYVKHLMKYTPKKATRMSEISKVSRLKISVQIFFVFLCTSNEQTETEVKAHNTIKI